MNQMRRSFLALMVACCVFSAPPVLLEGKPKEISEDTKAKASKEGIDLNDKSSYDSQKVVLREILELENSIQTYMLSYEAYLEARHSTDKKVQERIPGYLKNYREAYARFLSKVREDKLDHPLLPKDHANLYKKKWEATNASPIEFRTPGIDEMKNRIQEMVKQGASPDQIKKHIKASLHLERPDPKGPGPKGPLQPVFADLATAKDALKSSKDNAACNGWDPCSAQAYFDTVKRYRDSLYALKAPLEELEAADQLLIESKQMGWNLKQGYPVSMGSSGSEPYPSGVKRPKFGDEDRDSDRGGPFGGGGPKE